MTHQTLMTSMVAMLATNCAFIPPGDDVSDEVGSSSGEIIRDGTSVDFFGYDPVSASTQFGASLAAAGFIDIEGGGRVLAVITLDFENAQQALGARPEHVPVAASFANDEIGLGLSYLELPDDGAALFRHQYLAGAGAVSGEFAIEETDWSTFLRGHLNAVVDDPIQGNREFDLRIEWIGPKD